MAASAYFDFDKSDPMWDKVPAMGMEGLLNTVDDRKELLKELVKLNNETKKKKRQSPHSLAPIQSEHGSMDSSTLFTIKHFNDDG